MATVSVSIPQKLKEQTQKLIDQGYFSSMSDAIRASLRTTIQQSRYNKWKNEAKIEYDQGKAMVIRDAEDLEKLFE